ncbi:MAG: hypothetical protein ACOC3G_08600 [Phycisphaeraceae bacterium]
MATMSPAGRIARETVEQEIARLRHGWGRAADGRQAGPGDDDVVLLEQVLGMERAGEFDLFDRVQLAGVIRTCRGSTSLSDAGRKLFAVSRQQRSTVNDADRLRKYLTKWGLDWDALAAADA